MGWAHQNKQISTSTGVENTKEAMNLESSCLVSSKAESNCWYLWIRLRFNGFFFRSVLCVSIGGWLIMTCKLFPSSAMVRRLRASASWLFFHFTYTTVLLYSSIFCFHLNTLLLSDACDRRFLWSVKMVISAPNRKLRYSLRTSTIANISCSIVGYLLYVGVSFLEKYAIGEPFCLIVAPNW